MHCVVGHLAADWESKRRMVKHPRWPRRNSRALWKRLLSWRHSWRRSPEDRKTGKKWIKDFTLRWVWHVFDSCLWSISMHIMHILHYYDEFICVPLLYVLCKLYGIWYNTRVYGSRYRTHSMQVNFQCCLSHMQLDILDFQERLGKVYQMLKLCEV